MHSPRKKDLALKTTVSQAEHLKVEKKSYRLNDRVKNWIEDTKRVDLRDQKTFVITADEADDDEEMISLKDLEGIVDLAKDEEKYRPLHSHVEHYNRRAADAAKKYHAYVPVSHLNLEENHLAEDEKPFIAGFKHELDKHKYERPKKTIKHIPLRLKKSFASRTSVNRASKNKKKSSMKNTRPFVRESRDRAKRGENEEDLVDSMSPRNETQDYQEHENTTSLKDPSSSTTTERVEEYVDEKTETFETAGSSHPYEGSGDNTAAKRVNIFRESELTTAAVTEEEEEAYDYDSLRAEYDQQIADARRSNTSFNYTDNSEPEDTPGDAIKKIVDFGIPKNCTEEELKKFGAKAFACLAYDYGKAKNRTEARRIIARTWNVVKIWILIYVCIAVPAWCQKGWCCCCFRCSCCFPYVRIAAVKAYYARNEPGVLVDQPGKKGQETKPIKYKPTLFEIDAYEELESAIRNL